MPSISITWNTQKDERVCPVCLAMHGTTWTFRDEPMPTQLFHPLFPFPVWDVNTGSEAHGHHQGSCRCFMTHRIDIKDVVEHTKEYCDKIKAALNE